MLTISRKILYMVLGSMMALVIVGAMAGGTAVFAQEGEDSTPQIAQSQPKITQSEGNPYYFIAIHLEPWDAAIVAAHYPILESMVLDANQHNVKLTLMFSTRWADYIRENDKLNDIIAWKNQGHEIAIHHHSIHHGGRWDGYTAYTEEEAIAKRIELGHIPPEEYLGTLDDFMTKVQFLNPTINSGCPNEASDVMAMPDDIIYATCSGYQNFGTPGTRLPDWAAAEKGKNEFITTAFVNGIERKWLAHFQLHQDPLAAKQVFSLTDSDKVYGVAMHNENSDAADLHEYLEFLNSIDPTAEKSRTVTEIIESGLLPEEQITVSAETVYLPIVTSNYQPTDSFTLLSTTTRLRPSSPIEIGV